MYAELVCRSNYAFLKGASFPDELVEEAHRLGLSALALTDDDGLYGMPRAHLAAKSCGLKLLVGSRMTLTDGPPVVLYVARLPGYKNLCRLISESRLAHPKGEAGLSWRKVAERAEGLIALLPMLGSGPGFGLAEGGRVPGQLAEAFPGRFYVGFSRTRSAEDERCEAAARALARRLEVPCCAHNDVHTHVRARQPLQDVLTAIRHQVGLAQAGRRLFPNAERTLKGPEEMAALFSDCPEALGRTLEISGQCDFSLDELAYHFPEEDLPPGRTALEHLRELVAEGLAFRYPAGVPEPVRRQVAHELTLIGKLGYEGYFLTLHDLVRFARSRGILCQGRGSAANSVVCYALRITAIDPVRMGLLFERFLSEHRTEPPDIDVDFEHVRREEVLQYVYEKYGRQRAGMVCEVITYRGRLALREVGKALGLSIEQVDRLAKGTEGLGMEGLTPEALRELGLSHRDRSVALTLELSRELVGFPRHLSIHVGGFVITREPLSELVPLENAAMAKRTVVQWEKDDLNALGILKVDLLALGMLTAISRCFQLMERHQGVALTLATIPPEDPAVYDMLCEGDAIGVFQIESRAQMNMLPRLKPRCFYDLVIEIALIRPGPIIGDMVHPYLRRRAGTEKVEYPSEAVREILGKTLGVPLFQEQAMRLAMVAAGFSAKEADELRRILSHKRAEELLIPFQARFVEGCVKRGYERAYAEKCFSQFRGFSHYGFPESHSASFALIAYASAYLARYYPAAFCAALIDAQPMGFYAVHTLVANARRHGVEVRPIDVNVSDWDCALEPPRPAQGERGPALRLGLRQVKGLQKKQAERLVEARGRGYASVGDLAFRARLSKGALLRLAAAGALDALCGNRRKALWQIQALGPLDETDLFFGLSMDEREAALPAASLGEAVAADVAATGLSLRAHPVSLVRSALNAKGALTARALSRGRAGRRVGVGGMVICRQRPPAAKGICFLSLEDETGIANLVVSSTFFERHRKTVIGGGLLYAEGRIERSGKVVNLKVEALEPLRFGG